MGVFIFSEGREGREGWGDGGDGGDGLIFFNQKVFRFLNFRKEWKNSKRYNLTGLFYRDWGT